MKPRHLTYCLNVHPGETWAENFGALQTRALAVRDLVSPRERFGLGLRLSAVAAAELHQAGPREEFKRFLERENLYVFTINGFPFGRFHGGCVKENVYAPDWRSPERLEYTLQLADILADLLPEGCEGTISTVPCSWKPWMKSGADLDALTLHLTSAAAWLSRLRESHGRDIILALEPEPGCYLETTDESVRFFAEHLFPRAEVARRHLGICFDACHIALQFEELPHSLRAFRAAGICVPKVQISSALRTDGSRAGLEALAPFAEKVYLHQTIARGAAGERLFWPDLAPALAELRPGRAEEIRVHFHVPLDWSGTGALASTAGTMTPEFFALLRQEDAWPQLEIETYTWDVLPPNLRAGTLEQSIAREFAWVLKRMGEE